MSRRCSNCKWASWPENKTGNPNVKGTCTYPVPDIPSTYVLSKALTSGTHHIRPDFGQYCACHDYKETE